jgi:hypothetical protein
MLNAVLRSMRLQDTVNILVLNPNSPVGKNQIYGYRKGFADHEIAFLRQHADLFGDIDVDIPSKPTSVKTAPVPPELIPKDNDHLNLIDYEKLSEDFSHWYIKQLSDYRQEGLNFKPNAESSEDADLVLDTLRPRALVDILDLAQLVCRHHYSSHYFSFFFCSQRRNPP